MFEEGRNKKAGYCHEAAMQMMKSSGCSFAKQNMVHGDSMAGIWYSVYCLWMSEAGKIAELIRKPAKETPR